MIVITDVTPEVGEPIVLGTINIMGHGWEVVGFRGTHDYTQGTSNLGYCMTGINRIGLCLVSPDGERLPDSSIASTLLHELVHITSDYAGVELTETQVEAFANVLFQTLVANGVFYVAEGA